MKKLYLSELSEEERQLVTDDNGKLKYRYLTRDDKNMVEGWEDSKPKFGGIYWGSDVRCDKLGRLGFDMIKMYNICKLVNTKLLPKAKVKIPLNSLHAVTSTSEEIDEQYLHDESVRQMVLYYCNHDDDGVLWISPDDLIEFDISPYMHDGRDVNYITRNDKDKIECWAAKPLADVDDIAHKHVIIANNFIGNKKLYSSVKDFIGDVIKIHGTDYKNIVNDKIEELYVDKCDIYVYVSDKVAYCIHKSMLKYINTHNEKNAINCDKYNESLIGLNEVKRLRW